MSARYVSSQLIKNIQRGGKAVAVECVDNTSAWTRPEGFPSTSVKSDFTQVAQENAASIWGYVEASLYDVSLLFSR